MASLTRQAAHLPLTVAREALKTCGNAARNAASAVSNSGKAPRPRPRTGAIALEASYVIVDLRSFDFGPYRFEGREPLGVLTTRMMVASVYEGDEMIAERRVPMRHDNSEGLHADDIAELRQAARAMREELYNCSRQSGRPVVSIERARARRRKLQPALRR